MLKLYFYETNNYAIFMINYDFSCKNIFLKRTCESRILGKKIGVWQSCTLEQILAYPIQNSQEVMLNTFCSNISIKQKHHHRISHKNRRQWHQQPNPLRIDLKPLKKQTKKAKLGVEVTTGGGGWKNALLGV